MSQKTNNAKAEEFLKAELHHPANEKVWGVAGWACASGRRSVLARVAPGLGCTKAPRVGGSPSEVGGMSHSKTQNPEPTNRRDSGVWEKGGV